MSQYVFHCHILPHEDAGMMMAVLALPAEADRRVALGDGPGEGGSATVQDARGQAIGRVSPLPRGWRGGVATATGDLDGEGAEDVVAGPASRGSRAAFVTVYDGDTLRRRLRFRPFPESPHAGVSLATGDLDRDGRAEIVVGRVAPGTSLIRIFRADGTPWRDVSGVLPASRAASGVTVASADFNGDNYDDLAIGAGAGPGRLPRVVGLDGYALGGPDGGSRVTIFDFEAPGGVGSGVNLAGGTLDPRTRPGFLANLITTPQAGRAAGTVTVYGDLTGAEGGHAAGDSTAHRTMVAMPPTPIATFRSPAGKAGRGLRLAVARLGRQGLAALASWSGPRRFAYQAIDDAGAISTVKTPVT